MNLQFFIANVGHLTPYALMLLAYLLLSFQSELFNNRLFAVPLLGLLLFFAGLRDVMDPDMERYREMYENAGVMSSASIEPSFLFLSRFLRSIGFDYHALFFLYTFITLLFIYLGIKNYTDYIKLSFLLFILLPGYFLNMFVEMREVCSVAIAFYATSILCEKQSKLKVVRCLIFAVLSILFHYAAIVYWIVILLSYAFARRTYSYTLYLLLLIPSLLIPTSLLINILEVVASPVLPARYQGYFNVFMEFEAQQLGERGQIIKSLIYIIMAICFLYWGRRLREDDSYPIQLNLFIIGVIILNVTHGIADVSRLAYFFLIYQIVIFPKILSKVMNRGWRLAADCSLVLFYLAQFGWGLFFYSEEAGEFIFLHYRNVLLSALR